MKEFRNKFKELANDLQSEIEAAVEEHLGFVRRTLDMVRNDNVALESEQDPAFRGRVGAKIGTAKNNIRRIQAAFDL